VNNRALAEAANREARARAESAERYDLRRAAQIRREWCDYHRHLAGVHERLAQRHRQALGRLIDGGPGGVLADA
jgi:hypothetical protein